MGLFKNIFKRKPGGTFVGNLLRGIGDKFTGGIYSKIFKAPPAAPAPAPTNTGIAGGRSLDSNQPQNSGGIMQTLKSKAAYIVGGVLGVAGIIWAIIRFSKPKKRSYGRR